MPAVYTAAADAIIKSGAVQHTNPVDGDAATAASNNIGINKIADVVKKLVDTAGWTDAVNLWTARQEFGDGRGVVQVISQNLWITHNALWTGTQWNRINAAAEAFAIRLGYNGIVAGTLIQFLYSADADPGTNFTWRDTYGGGTGGGLTNGIIHQPAVTDIAGGSFLNSYVQVGTDPAAYWKDPMGNKHLQGACTITAGTNGASCFVLPSTMWPGRTRVFSCWVTGAEQPIKVTVSSVDGSVVITRGALTGNVWFDGMNWR